MGRGQASPSRSARLARSPARGSPAGSRGRAPPRRRLRPNPLDVRIDGGSLDRNGGPRRWAASLTRGSTSSRWASHRPRNHPGRCAYRPHAPRSRQRRTRSKPFSCHAYELDGRPAGKPQHLQTHQPRRTPKAMNRPVASSTEEFDAAAAAIDVAAAATAPPVPGEAPPPLKGAPAPPVPGPPAPPVPDAPPTADGWREQALGALSRARDHLLGAPAPRGLVEGRARDERDDGRRGPAAARVPRASATPRRPSARPLDPLAAARGRLVGQLLRRPRRPLDDDRGLRRAAAGRRRARGASTCGAAARCPRRRRTRAGAGVHAHLAGAVRRVAVGAACRCCRPR